MSGIVGIVNLDGAPVDRDLLRAMTDFMAYRGPDAQEVWTEGHVGLADTMLRTTWEAETERQPLSFDGKVWLTADARIDGRAELIAALDARGRQDVKGANDAELILHAYHVWGEDCVEHLTGRLRLRHLGRLGTPAFLRERPLRRQAVLLRAGPRHLLRLQQHARLRSPASRDRIELNDLAIGDFLLFGDNQDVAATTFRDIMRLPAGHRLTVRSHTCPQPARYWSVPADFTFTTSIVKPTRWSKASASPCPRQSVTAFAPTGSLSSERGARLDLDRRRREA